VAQRLLAMIAQATACDGAVRRIRCLHPACQVQAQLAPDLPPANIGEPELEQVLYELRLRFVQVQQGERLIVEP